ncbi:MAG: DnaJ family domain-containing protein [Litorilinea sp.]
MSTPAKPSPRATDSPRAQDERAGARPAKDSRPKDSHIPEPTPQSEEERLRLARARAQSYRSEAAPDAAELELAAGQTDVDEDLPETLDEWMSLVSNRVEEAMRRGLFDNLPGKGKPQPLQRDPFVPEDRQMAFNLMKKNQITPGWIGDRKTILGAIDALRGEMRALGATFRAREENSTATADRARLAHEWGLCVTNWEERVRLLNIQILNLNLTQPFHYLEVYKLRLDEELKRAGVTRTLGTPD